MRAMLKFGLIAGYYEPICDLIPHNLSRGYTSDFLLGMVKRFFLIVASPACSGGYTWRQILARVTKSVILSQKIQFIEFLAIFSAIFFSCHITCAL